MSEINGITEADIHPEAKTAFQNNVHQATILCSAYELATGHQSDYQKEVEDFSKNINLLPEHSKQTVIEAIEHISFPKPEKLEKNGNFVRKLSRLHLFPEIAQKFDNVYSDKQKQFRQDQLQAEIAAYEQKSIPPIEDYISLMQDAELLFIIDSVPLPVESDTRQQIRQQLIEENQCGFGNDVLLHGTEQKIIGNQLLPLKDIDRLAFSGAITTKANKIETWGLGAHEWSSIEELQSLAASNPEIYQRIIHNLSEADRQTGFHPVASHLNKAHRRLLGLDKEIGFNLGSLYISQGGNKHSNFYGSVYRPIPISETTNDVTVSLNDDVMINDSEPETIVKYANELISLHQFQELIIDAIEAGEMNVENWCVPERKYLLFSLNDNRPEIQIRKPVMVTPNEV